MLIMVAWLISINVLLVDGLIMVVVVVVNFSLHERSGKGGMRQCVH